MCSLTKSFHSTKLWAKYGGGGYGVAIEYEIPNPHSDGFYEVVYLKSHTVVDINDIIRAGLTEDYEVQKRVILGLMCSKTKAWKFEDEIRHIASAANQYSYIAPISRVLFGPNVPSKIKNDYRAKYKSISFASTAIKGGIIVEH